VRKRPTPSEILLPLHLKELDVFVKKEYHFDKKRKFRFDFACVERKLAFEINGGIWTQGRHTRGAGFLRDMEKLNLACGFHGWTVLQFTPEQVLTGYARDFVRRMLDKRE
jgi:very-short-patch-repair endonuclease